MDLQRRFSRVFGSEGPFAGNRRSWLCATVSRAVTANKLFHNDLHTNPRSESERGLSRKWLCDRELAITWNGGLAGRN